MADFEAASGIKLTQYSDGKEMGQQLKLVQRLNPEGQWGSVFGLIKTLKRELEIAEADLVKMVSVREPKEQEQDAA